jgi:hypothetical protein
MFQTTNQVVNCGDYSIYSITAAETIAGLLTIPGPLADSPELTKLLKLLPV